MVEQRDESRSRFCSASPGRIGAECAVFGPKRAPKRMGTRRTESARCYEASRLAKN